MMALSHPHFGQQWFQDQLIQGGAFALSWIAFILNRGRRADDRGPPSRWDCGRKQLFQADGVLTIWAKSAPSEGDRQRAFALFADGAHGVRADRGASTPQAEMGKSLEHLV